MHTSVEGVPLSRFLPTIKEIDKEGNDESVSVCEGEGPMTLQGEVDIPELIAGDIPPEPKSRQQAMDSPEREEWGKSEEVETHGMVENYVYK